MEPLLRYPSDLHIFLLLEESFTVPGTKMTPFSLIHVGGGFSLTAKFILFEHTNEQGSTDAQLRASVILREHHQQRKVSR